MKLLESNILESFQKFLGDKIDKIISELPSVFLAILLMLLGFFVAKPIAKWIANILVGRHKDQLVKGFVENTTRIVISIIFIVWALQFSGYGYVANTILAGAGIGTILLGLAFQDIAQNFIGGIVLIFNRPFEKDDFIKIGDIKGKVQAIKLRYSVLTTDEGKEVFIPNGDLIKNPLYNNSIEGLVRTDFTIVIAGISNLEEIQQLIITTINSIDDIANNKKHNTYVIVENVKNEESSLRIYYWIKVHASDYDLLDKKSEVISKVSKTLVNNGNKVNVSLN